MPMNLRTVQVSSKINTNASGPTVSKANLQINVRLVADSLAMGETQVF